MKSKRYRDQHLYATICVRSLIILISSFLETGHRITCRIGCGAWDKQNITIFLSAKYLNFERSDWHFSRINIYIYIRFEDFSYRGFFVTAAAWNRIIQIEFDVVRVQDHYCARSRSIGEKVVNMENYDYGRELCSLPHWPHVRARFYIIRKTLIVRRQYRRALGDLSRRFKIKN